MPTLQWIGKDKVISHHLDVPVRELKHEYGFKEKQETKTPTWSGNKIIHGDNLEALKAPLLSFPRSLSFSLPPPWRPVLCDMFGGPPSGLVHPGPGMG